MVGLKEKFLGKVGPMRERIQKLLKEKGNVKVDDVALNQVIGGMRDINSMLWVISDLDPQEGIRFRGLTIPDLQAQLPRAHGGSEPLPEALFYFLLTGDVPTEEDTKAVTEEWRRRSALPEHLIKSMEAVPTDTHPMTQFGIAILALQRDSKFAARYRTGMPKSDYWDPMYEDVMDLLAKLPEIAARIYMRSYKGGKFIAPDPKLDWGANLGHMIGIDKPDFLDLMRLYLVIHSDHEGGNVSAHTCHLVGSALSDAYYSMSAAMGGLAGPLHGLANQEVLRWIMDVMKDLNGVPNKEQLHKYLWDTLKSGKVIPGYGHAVLRKTDPRYVAQREFALKHLPNYDMFKVVSDIYQVAPPILIEQGKAKNPWPNVDAHSGVLLYYYGVTEYDFYTVFFGVSRAMGILAQLVWDRALGLAIERPKSVLLDWLEEEAKKA
jgi:citrate synthase